MDVPKGPLRQDAELGRSRCESEDFSEITNTIARSRRVDPRREDAVLPGANNQRWKMPYRWVDSSQSGLGVPMPSSQKHEQQ